MGERRQCPRCGALLVAEATWCPQCFLGFRQVFRPRAGVPPPPPRPDVLRVADLVETARADGRAAVASEPQDRSPAGWPCPVCRYLNPLERNACEVCTTPFSRLFQEKRPVRNTDPRRAAIASLVFPGLGHADAGRIGEGVVRAVLFVWTLATGIALAMIHSPGDAGLLGPVAALFFAAAAAVYALSAVDATRIGTGRHAILSPRVLTYGSAVLVLVSVGTLFVLVLHAHGAVHALRRP